MSEGTLSSDRDSTVSADVRGFVMAFSLSLRSVVSIRKSIIGFVPRSIRIGALSREDQTSTVLESWGESIKT